VVSGVSDVLVVGAGPTGCAAGIVLARRGLRVVLVDRQVFPRDKTCGDAVSNDGLDILTELGAKSAVDREAHATVRRGAAVFPDGTRITRQYERPGFIVPRYHLDDCLRRAAEAAGARVLQGHSVACITRDGDRFTGAEGPGFSWKARAVIAADGYGSVGLAALGTDRPRGRFLAVSTTAYYRNVDFPYGEDTADHYFDEELPFGYGWIFPAVEGVSNVGVYVRADEYARTGQKLKVLMQGFLERRAPRLRLAELVSGPRVFPLPLAPRPMPVAAPGLLLAGDAAGLVDPLSGEGIWQGLRSGVLAGETAADAVSRGDLDRALCRRYEQACARSIVRPSRAKAWVQRAMFEVVRRRLYENLVVRASLAWGYDHARRNGQRAAQRSS
jgi:geranylgeranyl reductase family protein